MIGTLLLAAVAWVAPVQVADREGPWASAPVPGWIERETSGDLRRIRLVDARGREVPYRLLDAATQRTASWRQLPMLNTRATPDGFAFELDIGHAAPVDALEIGLDGPTGVLEAAVTAGEPAGELTAGARIGRLQGIAVQRVDLPVTDAGRLAVRLTTLVPGVEPARVRVRHTLRPPADDAAVAYRAVRLPGAEGRDRWRLVAADEAARIDGLVLDVRSPEVLRRRVVVRTVGGSDAPVVGRGEIARLPLADGRPGIASLRLAVQPGAWRSIEVEIERSGEAPAELGGARGEVARRWLLFPRTDGAGGLRLVSSEELRSDTLERGPLPVLPAEAVPAVVGPAGARTEPPPPAPAGGPSLTVSLLFVLAAALLGLLAWRALGRSG